MFTIERFSEITTDAFIVEYLQAGWEEAIGRILERMNDYQWDFKELSVTRIAYSTLLVKGELFAGILFRDF